MQYGLRRRLGHVLVVGQHRNEQVLEAERRDERVHAEHAARHSHHTLPDHEHLALLQQAALTSGREAQQLRGRVRGFQTISLSSGGVETESLK